MEEQKQEEEKYKKAKQKVAQLKAFYINLVTFIVVNLILFIINLVIGGGWWFYWVTIFWGIAVIVHAISVFTGNKFDNEWEEKKIKEEMEKKD
ncbi:MAG: 2TM domain-containing protein [Patescibacteria group bacterium]|jgi:uncharacterized ion transporter superfamily protein YfcC